MPGEPSDGDVSRLLRDERERAGLTVRELGRRMGVSPATISAAERGADVRLGTLQLFASTLPALTASRLLHGEDALPAFDARGAWDFLRAAMGLVASRVTVEAELEPGGALVVHTTVSAMRLLRAAEPADVARLVETTWIRTPPPADAKAALLRGEPVELEERWARHAARLSRANGPRPRLDYSHRERRVAGIALPWGTEAAFSPAFHESPGFAVAVQAPVESLLLSLRGPAGAIPRDLALVAWPAGLLASDEEIDLAPSVAPLPAVERDESSLRVTVEHPLPGFSYGLLWGEGRPRRRRSVAVPVASRPRGTPGRALQLAREATGESRRELARRVGVSASTIVEAERDVRELRASTARLLLDALPALRAEHLLRDARVEAPVDAAEIWRLWRDLVGFATGALHLERDLREPGLVVTTARVEESRTTPGRTRRLKVITRAGRGESLRSEEWTHPVEILGAAEGVEDEMTMRFVREGRHLVGLVQVVPADVAAAGLSTSSRGETAVDPAAPLPRRLGESIVAPLGLLRVTVRLPESLLGVTWEAKAWPACEPETPSRRNAWPKLGAAPVVEIEGDTVTLTVEHPCPGFYHALVARA